MEKIRRADSWKNGFLKTFIAPKHEFAFIKKSAPYRRLTSVVINEGRHDCILTIQVGNYYIPEKPHVSLVSIVSLIRGLDACLVL